MGLQRINIAKLLSIIAFIFIILALLIIADTPPATGYEISIYGAYPLYFWFFLIGSIACGVSILLHQAFSQERSRWWLSGLAVIIFANSIFLLLPEFRGYALYGWGDMPTHLGYIKDILVSGHIGDTNFYPIEHILGTSLIQVAQVSRENIPCLFFVLFSGLYIVNMCLLARIVSSHFGQALLVIAFASPLIYSFYHASIHPSFLALYMLPLLLYFNHKRERYHERIQNSVVLILLAFCITFAHPIVALFAIAIFLGFGLAHALYSRLFIRQNPQAGQYEIVGRNFLGISLIMIIAFFTWYSSLRVFQLGMVEAYNWLMQGAGMTTIGRVLGTLAQGEGVTLLQMIGISVSRYGAIFVLLLISIACFLLVLKKSLSRKRESNLVFLYATLFLIALLIGSANLFGHFLEASDPVRIARLPLFVGTVLSGLVVYGLIEGRLRGNPSRKASRGLVLMAATGTVIVAVAAMSMGSVYFSPRVCRPNPHVTGMEIAGVKWLQERHSPGNPVVADRVARMVRLEDYLYGRESLPYSKKIAAYNEPLPSHFGYDEFNSLAEALDFQDRSVVIDKVSTVALESYPPNVRPNLPWQWTEEDFAKLNSDPTAAQIYANGEFGVWRVFGVSEQGRF